MKYRFLIDANISIALEKVAQAFGHEAYHVRTLGRENDGDPVLLKLIEAEGYTLVTNNIEEFRNRYRNRKMLHAGVVFIAEANRGRAYQVEAFKEALHYIDTVTSIDDTEILIQPGPASGYRLTAAPLP